MSLGSSFQKHIFVEDLMEEVVTCAEEAFKHMHCGESNHAQKFDSKAIDTVEEDKFCFKIEGLEGFLFLFER